MKAEEIKMKFLVILIIVLWALLCGVNIYEITWGTGLSQMGTLFAALNIALTSANVVIWTFLLERVKKGK